MASISSGVGLISGINSKDIIDQLMALEAAPKTRIQDQMKTESDRKTAIADLQVRLTTLRLFGTTMKKTQAFKNAAATSSDESSLTATTAIGAAPGSYRMSVARLVTAQQAVSQGFADFDTTKIGAGTFTVELGGGELSTENKLEDLNGGDGVRRGQFRITDRSGATAVIDTTDAINLDDVVKKINNSLDIHVKASIANDKLVLTDTTGRTTSHLIVEDVGDGHGADDLGIVGNVNAATLTGGRIQALAYSTNLAKLNDGRGVRVNTDATKADFTVHLNDGSDVDISLAGATTVGQIVTKVSEQANGKFYVSLSANKKGFVLHDNTYNSDPDNDPLTPAPDSNLSVTAANGSNALADLGLDKADSGGTINGDATLAGLGTTLLSSLKGGTGINNLGTIHIHGRDGSSHDIALSGSQTVQDILDRINTGDPAVQARLKDGGNGIEIEDTTGQLGALAISDLSGTAATDLGISGSFGFGQTVRGDNLQKAWFKSNSLLKDLNGGKGVPAGTFDITSTAGLKYHVTISDSDTTVDDVIKKINAATTGKVTASINANGDGLLISDTAGGALPLKVEDGDNSTVATSLNIASEAAGTTIDGSWEKTIAFTADDTLQSAQTKINNLNWGVTGSIINDGSGDTPYRLSLSANNTGRAGHVAYDTGASDLSVRTLVDAQDAAVFIGSENSAQPLLVTASSNTISGAIRGVTLNLTGISKEPVTLNVARNVDNVVDAANKFTQDFNDTIDKLKEYTSYDQSTNTRGILLGEPSAADVETQLYATLQTVVAKDGKYRVAADVGIKLGDDGHIEFDEDKFRAAFSDDPEAVTRLFTQGAETLDESYSIQRLRGNQGIRLTTPETQPDIRVNLRDGTGVDVDLSTANTLGDTVDLLNTALGTKGNASIDSANNRLVIQDTSSGRKQPLSISDYPGSTAAYDLGISGIARTSFGTFTNTFQGKSLLNFNNRQIGGIGTAIESRINKLIDPVEGELTLENTAIDDRNTEFQNRIDELDKRLTTKRAQLEEQFANLETSLSSLQGQQSALSSLGSIKTSS